MSGRRVRCVWCGVQLMVPPNAQSIRCVLCNTVTVVQQNDLWSQSPNSKHRVTTKIKEFLGTKSSNINMIVASVNRNPKQMTSNHSHYPQLVRPVPSLVTFSAKGKKRAVLCGVSYHGQKHSLKGTINDVRSMKYFLIERMGFPNDSIILLSGILTNLSFLSLSLIDTCANICRKSHILHN